MERVWRVARLSYIRRLVIDSVGRSAWGRRVVRVVVSPYSEGLLELSGILRAGDAKPKDDPLSVLESTLGRARTGILRLWLERIPWVRGYVEKFKRVSVLPRSVERTWFIAYALVRRLNELYSSELEAVRRYGPVYRAYVGFRDAVLGGDFDRAASSLGELLMLKGVEASEDEVKHAVVEAHKKVVHAGLWFTKNSAIDKALDSIKPGLTKLVQADLKNYKKAMRTLEEERRYLIERVVIPIARGEDPKLIEDVRISSQLPGRVLRDEIASELIALLINNHSFTRGLEIVYEDFPRFYLEEFNRDNLTPEATTLAMVVSLNLEDTVVKHLNEKIKAMAKLARDKKVRANLERLSSAVVTLESVLRRKLGFDGEARLLIEAYATPFDIIVDEDKSRNLRIAGKVGFGNVHRSVEYVEDLKRRLGVFYETFMDELKHTLTALRGDVERIIEVAQAIRERAGGSLRMADALAMLERLAESLREDEPNLGNIKTTLRSLLFHTRVGDGESIPPLAWALEPVIAKLNSEELAQALEGLVERGYATIFLISYFEFMGMRQDEEP